MAPTGVNTINFIFDLRGPALACHLWLALVSLVLHYLQVDADPQILSYSFKQKNISLTRVSPCGSPFPKPKHIRCCVGVICVFIASIYAMIRSSCVRLGENLSLYRSQMPKTDSIYFCCNSWSCSSVGFPSSAFSTWIGLPITTNTGLLFGSRPYLSSLVKGDRDSPRTLVTGFHFEERLNTLHRRKKITNMNDARVAVAV